MKIWGDQDNLDILLVNTPLSDYSKPHAGHTIFWPPMGLAYLASYLSHKGFRVGVWDAEADKVSPEDIAEGIAELKPRYAGFNTFTPALDVLQDIMERRGEKFPDVNVLLGGVHATVATEDILRLPGMEGAVAVRNDGEKKVEALLNGVAPENVPGVGMRRKNEYLFINEEDFTSFTDINSEEAQLDRRFVPYDPTIEGNPASPDGKRRAFTSTSRGCPWKCKFCASSFKVREGGMKYAVRFRKASLVAQEMLDIANKGVKDIKQNDDLGFSTEKRIREIFEPVVNAGHGRKTGLEIRGNGRANILAKAKDETLDLMAEAGVKRVSMGAEQGTVEGMISIQKDTNPTEILVSCQRLAERGIATTYNFMYGVPGQDEREMKAEIALATRTILIGREYNVANEIDSYRFKPFTGTEYYNELRKAGYSDEQLRSLKHVQIKDGGSLSDQIETDLSFSAMDRGREEELAGVLRSLNGMATEELQEVARLYPEELYLEPRENKEGRKSITGKERM